MKKNTLMAFSMLAACALMAVDEVVACTRVAYKDGDNNVITGRTMDWDWDDNVAMRIFPRGAERDGATGENTVRWTSRYGSVCVVSFGGAVNAGMNEKGFAVDCLWLASSDYGQMQAGEKTLSTANYVLFLLDNFATVAEAVDYLHTNPIRIQTMDMPGGNDLKLTIHFALSDPSGDNAVIEYIGGEMKIYRRETPFVITNDPPYDVMSEFKALYNYRGLERNMPGSSHAVDRFLRASGWLEALSSESAKKFISAIPDQDMANGSVASVFGVMRAVSTPLGVNNKDNPENSATLWRVVNDLSRRVMFFESACAPTLVWVAFDDLDFGNVEMLLQLDGGRIINGNAARMFEEAEPMRSLHGK